MSGSTARTFKKRYYGHRGSFSNQKYEHDTELSKYIWKLKRDNKTYRVKWKIIDRASPYNPTKPNLPNQTFQTNPTKPNLPNQNLPNRTFQTKLTNQPTNQ